MGFTAFTQVGFGVHGMARALILSLPLIHPSSDTLTGILPSVPPFLSSPSLPPLTPHSSLYSSLLPPLLTPPLILALTPHSSLSSSCLPPPHSLTGTDTGTYTPRGFPTVIRPLPIPWCVPKDCTTATLALRAWVGVRTALGAQPPRNTQSSTWPGRGAEGFGMGAQDVPPVLLSLAFRD